MPFSTTASVVSTDLDNMLRGLHRSNADGAVTGTTVDTTLFSISISANTIGATGGFHVLLAGTLAGTAGTKTLRLLFGSTTLATITQAAGTTSDWYFDAWCFNTATGAQRWFIQRNGNDLLTSTFDYTTSAIDTTANQNLNLQGQLGNSGDTITKTISSVFIVQIT